jgi:lysozyme
MQAWEVWGAMKTSVAGREHLIREEGSRLKAYRDSVGIWTIGVGHSALAGTPPIPKKGMKITAAEEHEILERDLADFEGIVDRAVKVSISQSQFDALVSLCFNIGPSAFGRSTVLKRLNEGDYLGAAEAILMWNKPPEIIGRRRREYALFKSGMESSEA